MVKYPMVSGSDFPQRTNPVILGLFKSETTGVPGLPGSRRGDQLCWRGGSSGGLVGGRGPGILVKHWMFQEIFGGCCEHLVDFFFTIL